jgi:hypothetical protein
VQKLLKIRGLRWWIAAGARALVATGGHAANTKNGSDAERLLCEVTQNHHSR